MLIAIDHGNKLILSAEKYNPQDTKKAQNRNMFYQIPKDYILTAIHTFWP